MIIDAPKVYQTKELWTLWKQAFGDSDEFLRVFESTAFSPHRSRCVTLDNKVVAALYWFDCSYKDRTVAYLYAVATDKAYRGRGLCSALMKDTHKHLEDKGYAGAVLVPGTKELFAFYERMGYKVCSRISELCCSSNEGDADIRRIDVGEYARLRRELLPENSVVQEKENLAFLETQAELYAGEDFLLAARCEKGVLYGAELLGNTDIAPAILHKLGAFEGRFRIQGNEKPFAMYLPIADNSLTPPEYFGLAFD